MANADADTQYAAATHKLRMHSALSTQYGIGNVDLNHEGLRINVRCDFETLYIHIQPWSRGYSIFVSDNPNDDSYDWRHVPQRFKHMQHPMYTQRDVVGAHHVPVPAILYAVEDVYSLVVDLHHRRTSQHNADLKRVEQAFERKLSERIHKSRPRAQPQVRTV